MIPAWLSIFDAILAVLLVEAGVVGAHLGMIPPMTGLLAFLLSFVIAILALLFGLIGLARTSASERRSGRRKAVVGIVLALLIAVPVGFAMWRWWSMPYPNINDITTDYDNPPQFVNPPGLSAGSMKYDRARLAPIQTRYYPKLDPLRLDEKPDDAFARVKAAANVAPLVGLQMAGQIPAGQGWFIVLIDPATRTVEGVETSYLFRFSDDFVIQVRPGPDANSSLVEMRSRSRAGTGDFGVNYNRIRDFFGLLKPGGDSGAASPS
ncbi:MAG TPA: DUF1499 domain-containing protein [Candidatus Binataceae bacterium]|nr:DUF1499 domain-containing protein [Candidatus Binataceae bacterium]